MRRKVKRERRNVTREPITFVKSITSDPVSLSVEHVCSRCKRRSQFVVAIMVAASAYRGARLGKTRLLLQRPAKD